MLIGHLWWPVPEAHWFCFIASYSCCSLKLIFHYSSQMFHLNWDTQREKKPCYSLKNKINLLLDIKATLQALWLCLVFYRKFQVFEIGWESLYDGEDDRSGLFWADPRVKADFCLHSKEYWDSNLPKHIQTPEFCLHFQLCRLTFAESRSAAGNYFIPYILTVLLWFSLFTKLSFSGDFLTHLQPWKKWLQLQILKINDERSPGAWCT